MSRSFLSLFEVDEDALRSFGAELRSALVEDERGAVVRLLELVGPAAERVRSAPLAVDVFLAAETHLPSRPVFVALRRAAASRALSLAWTSESLSLEGRLRMFDVLREDRETARRVDALLDGQGVPWFLRTSGSTCGSLSDPDAHSLAEALADIGDLPPELADFARALGDAQGGVFCHDALL